MGARREHYDDVLWTGMVICLESYLGPLDGGEGVRLEDQVLITEGGLAMLSILPYQDAWF